MSSGLTHFELESVRHEKDWDDIILDRMELWFSKGKGFHDPMDYSEFNRYFKSNYSFYNVFSRIDFVKNHMEQKRKTLIRLGWINGKNRTKSPHATSKLSKRNSKGI